MRILVIGGTGFIGSSLVRQLIEQSHRVTVFSRSTAQTGEVEQIHGNRQDLENHLEKFRKFAPDVVIDLILSSGRQAEELVSVMSGLADRIVAISSMDVYRACGVLHGSEPGPLEPLPLTEDSPLRTKIQTYPPEVLKRLQGVFGWIDDEYDKIPVERAIMSAPGIAGTILRLPMIYGPGDRLRRFFPTVKRIEDRRPAILFADDIAAWRSPRGYVENVAAAIALAAVSPQAAGKIYNVAERESFSELEWAQKIASQAGFQSDQPCWQGTFVVLPREQTPKHLLMPGNFAQHWVASSERIRQELSYAEIVDLDESIIRTIDWERAMEGTELQEAELQRAAGQGAEENSPPTPAVLDYASEDAALAKLHSVAAPTRRP